MTYILEVLSFFRVDARACWARESHFDFLERSVDSIEFDCDGSVNVTGSSAENGDRNARYKFCGMVRSAVITPLTLGRRGADSTPKFYNELVPSMPNFQCHQSFMLVSFETT